MDVPAAAAGKVLVQPAGTVDGTLERESRGQAMRSVRNASKNVRGSRTAATASGVLPINGSVVRRPRRPRADAARSRRRRPSPNASQTVQRLRKPSTVDAQRIGGADRAPEHRRRARVAVAEHVERDHVVARVAGRFGQHARRQRRDDEPLAPWRRQPTTSRALANASPKLSTTGFSASRMLNSRRCWTWYLTLPTASAPMPTARAAGQRLAVVHHADTGDAFGRHRVDVGRHQQLRRCRPIVCIHHLHAGRRRGQHHLGIGQRGVQLLACAGSDALQRAAEALAGLVGRLLRALGAAVAGQPHAGRAGLRRDDAGDAADRPGAAEDEHVAAGELGAVRLAQCRSTQATSAAAVV